MKNAGLAGALALVGAGLFANAFVGMGAAVQAKAVVHGATQSEPRIVDLIYFNQMHYRFWSNGIVDQIQSNSLDYNCNVDSGPGLCISEWEPVPGTTSGYIATSDVNGDGEINGEDLAVILAGWGSSSASLLVNPSLGSHEVIAACTSAHPEDPSNSNVLPVRRIWDTGLIEQGIVYVPIVSNLDCGCDNAEYFCNCITTWKVIENTIPLHLRRGDITEDGQTNGQDLAELLGRWGQ